MICESCGKQTSAKGFLGVYICKSCEMKYYTATKLAIDELLKKHEKEFEKIRVTRFRLKTELVNFSKYKIIGFVGKVVYELPETIDKEIKNTINALADFAFYSGVGYKTTMGMGQVRRA